MMSKNSGAPPPVAVHAVTAGSRPATITRGSKLDLFRMVAAELIGRIENADAAGRASLLLQVRSIQDQIVGIKHRLPLLSAQPSRLSWVDTWSPRH